MPSIFCEIRPSYLIRFSVCCHINTEASFITVTATWSSPRRRDSALLLNVSAESPSFPALLSAIVSPLSLLLHPFVLHRLYSSSFTVISFLICETLSSLSLDPSASPPLSWPCIPPSPPPPGCISLYLPPFPTSCRKHFRPLLSASLRTN